MKITIVETKQQQKRFLQFRKNLYQNDKNYVDNNYFMLKEIFVGKLHFVQNMEILPVYIEAEEKDVTGNDCLQEMNSASETSKAENLQGQQMQLRTPVRPGEILCEGVIAYAKELPECIQLCFFEALSGQQKAVDLLVEQALDSGRRYGCDKLVIGLFGHVNYGLGFLDSHYAEVNSFSSLGNPKYYNQYFRNMNCDEIKLNSYITHTLDDRLERYRAILNKLDRNYEFKIFDRRQFDYYSRIYTDLNNACFTEHRYYYHRDYMDDAEMLQELFLFMKGDSIVFAFHGNQPVGFIMWYPDYNELAKPGEIFGTKHFFKNIFANKRIRTAKVMEYGVLPEYRSTGLPMALIHKVYEILQDYGCQRVETSWILDENLDSNSFCMAICDERYKSYVVYEKPVKDG